MVQNRRWAGEHHDAKVSGIAGIHRGKWQMDWGEERERGQGEPHG